MPYTYVLLFMSIFTGIYLVQGGYKPMAMIDVIFAMPQLLQKFYAIKDERSVKIGMFASSVFALLVAGIAYFTGALTRIFLNPTSNPAAFENGKPVFDALMPEMLITVIPSALTVVILLLILAASMSTLASLVLISSTSITKDIYKGFINRNANDKQLTSLVRIGSIFFILLSMILAFFKPAVIVTILSISWGAIASVFLGPFIWGIFNKKVTRMGAIAGSVGGLLICIILFVVWGAKMVPQAGSVGMLASLTLVPMFSLFGKK